jgi:heme exporter protein CcmD
MNEIFDFGRHAPYIASAYGVSILALAALIFARRRKLKRAIEAERAQDKKN